MRKKFTREEIVQARELRAQGKTLHEIGRVLGRSHNGVLKHLKQDDRGSAPMPWKPRPDRLQAFEREHISVGLGQGKSLSAIARDLGRAPSSVSREVAANGGRDHYLAFDAHDRARGCAKRPKATKLDYGPLVEQVTS